VESTLGISERGWRWHKLYPTLQWLHKGYL
jgi:hypothetical protein